MGTPKNFCQQFLTEITMDYVISIITDIMFDGVKKKTIDNSVSNFTCHELLMELPMKYFCLQM
jgi:hypothetical protein